MICRKTGRSEIGVFKKCQKALPFFTIKRIGIAIFCRSKDAQNSADKLKCRIRAYSNQVTSLGTRPVFAVNAHLVPKWRWILSGTGEKTFYPRSNLKNDLWRYIVHRKVMIRWKRFWKKQSSQQRRWLLSVFSCKLRLCLIIIGVVCGKKALKLPASIKRHVKLLCRWNMFSIILQFPEQIYRCIQERR